MPPKKRPIAEKTPTPPRDDARATAKKEYKRAKSKRERARKKEKFTQLENNVASLSAKVVELEKALATETAKNGAFAHHVRNPDRQR